MSESERIDPERLAALLDGRLSESEAAVVRQQLASANEDSIGAYADAVAVARELSGDTPEMGTPARVLPMRGRWRTAPWAVASTVAAAAIVSVVVWRAARSGGAYEPGQFARAVPSGISATEGAVWNGVRGDANDLSAGVRAARAGALLTDLELDVRENRSPREHALALAVLLDGAVGGAVVAAPLRAAVADSASQLSPARLEEFGRTATELLDRRFTAAGAYLEAARLTTAVGDATFFDRVGPAVLTTLRDDAALDPSGRSLLAQFDTLLEQRPRDPRALNVATAQLLAAITK